MKPVSQARVNYRDGDCLRACIASVLELPLEAVPAYVEDDMQIKFVEWLQQFNMSLMSVRLGDPDGFIPPGYHLIEGPSRNGQDTHVAVGLDRQIVHDPDPTSRGQFEGDRRNYWIFTVIDPSKMLPPTVEKPL